MGIFKYAGTDLTVIGTGIELVDGMKGGPPIRGQNLLLPYQPGRRWVQKYYEERPVVLQGTALAASASQYETFLDRLKALFPIEAGEQKLELQVGDGSWRYIMAEVRNVLVQMQQSPLSGKFSIEFRASDPLWYSSNLEASQARQAWTFDSGVNFDDGAHWFDVTAQAFAQTLSTTPVIVEASNSGTAPVRKLVLQLRGAMVNPVITNLRNGLSLTTARSFVGADTLVIDCGAQTLMLNGTIALSPSIVTLGAGQVDWMRLEPGENSLQIALGTNPNLTSVQYQALYSAAYL